MSPDRRHQSLVWFRTLDIAFWVLWLAFPVMIWIAYQHASDPASALESLKPELANCSEILPRPGQMSAQGKAIYWTLFVFQLSIYAVLLWVLHRIVHRFAGEKVFVDETLASVQLMGIILLVWPFLDVAVNNAAVYALKSLGDLPHIKSPGFMIDIAPLAVGVFLIAVKYVLEQGIALKSENDLTI